MSESAPALADGESPSAAGSVPLALWQFQVKLLAPEGVSAVQLLGGYDDYINQGAVALADADRQVPIREIDGWRLTADIHRPPGPGPFPVLVYFHGGAFVMGAPASHRRLADDLAALGLIVAAIDYRRAPKFRFPAAVDDAAVAVQWVRDHARDLGADPDVMLVGGDSAGANLAAAVLAAGMVSDIAAALLFYGIFDVQRSLPQFASLVGGSDPDTQLYLRPDDFRELTNDPRLHPERFCAEFPPSLVLVGECDPTIDESRSLAAALTAHQVRHELVVVPGAPHGFLQFPTHDSHRAGLRAMADFLARQSVVRRAT